MKIVTVKKYSPKVFEQLAALYAQLTLSGRLLKPKDVRKFITDRNSELFALVDKGRYVGMTTLMYARTVRGLYGIVEDVVVDKEYRGRGLGKQLMRHLIARAKKKGCIAIEMTSRPVRVAAHGLYLSVGFEKEDTQPFYLKLK